LGEPHQIAISARRLSYAYTLHGDVDRALQFTQVAVKNFHAAGDPTSKAEALRHLGTTFVLIGRYVEAMPVLEESLTLQRSLNRSYPIAHNMGTLSMANMHLGEYDLARNYLAGCMPLFQNAGYWREYALSLLFLGCADLVQGRMSQASQNLLASASLLRKMQYGGELGWVLGAYALTELKLGNGKRARECLAESLKICVNSHSPLAASTCISAAALLLIEIGEYEAAISVYSTVSKLLIVSNSRWFMQVIGQRIAQAAELLASEEVRAAQERGKHRDTYEAAEWLLEKLSSGLFHPN
jgi:tetratricopeptide (TPR) repeat protein